MSNNFRLLKVAVVGAGLAGLTAAYRLCQQGFDVHVYEARPRVGGHVHTVNVKNLDGSYSLTCLVPIPYDMGTKQVGIISR